MKKYKDYILGAIIAILALLTFDGVKKNNDLSWKYALAKDEIIKLKQNIEVSDNATVSAIRDLEDEKSLRSKLKEEYKKNNEALQAEVDRLAAENKKIIGLGKVDYIYEKQIDTIYQEVSKLSWQDYYYPDKDGYVLKHSIWFQSDSVSYSKWDFNEIGLDLLISESESGVFSASLIGNDYVKVNNLKVNTLPLQTPEFKVNQFDFMIGVGYRFDKNFNFHAGVRLKNAIFFGTASSDRSISANLLIGI